MSPTSSDPSQNKIPVAIIGSCVSRDAFEFERASRFDLIGYYARTRLASFMGRATRSISPDYSKISSNFQRKTVAADITKNGRKLLREQQYSLLVIDLIDERFPLIRFADSGVATESNEFRKLGVARSAYTRIPPLHAESLDSWTAKWETLLRMIDATSDRGKIVVHLAQWCRYTAKGTATIDEVDVVDAANHWLSRAYEIMRLDLDASQFIRVSDENQVADDSHKWSIAPFHYVPAYYDEFIRKLERAAINQRSF